MVGIVDIQESHLYNEIGLIFMDHMYNGKKLCINHRKAQTQALSKEKFTKCLYLSYNYHLKLNKSKIYPEC